MIGTPADRPSRPAECLRRARLVLLSIVLLAFLPHLAMAQAVSGPASLTGVKVSAAKTGETTVLLSFNQILPQFSIVSNDNDRPLLGFGNTVRGSGAVVPPGEHGVLKAVEFNQRDSVLTISFVGASTLHVTATPVGGGRALSVSITAAAGKDASATAAPGGLPQFADRSRGEDQFEVVPLKYADISEVVGLLSAGQAIKPNDTFTPQEPAFGSSGMSNNGGGSNNNLLASNYNNPNGQDAAAAPYGQLVDDSIGVDRRLNAIILRGPPERIARLKEKIAELDVPVQSVVLETVFVELTQTGAKNVGLDFNNANGQIAVATYQRGTYLANNTGSGIDVAGYGSYALQVAIYAQVSKGEGRIISRPRISAQSGSSAKIITGDALPILTSIALSGVNAVSQQVQYVNVGVTLQIAPRVSIDGFVTSHIFCEVSSVTGYSQGYPTISQREASTSATVKDGDYFVIGGLSQETSLKTRGKVAGLGDVPLFGELFKLHLETHSKTELYIIVTPHIARAGDNMAARAEAQQ
jgi:general secretion pathway protein D